MTRLGVSQWSTLVFVDMLDMLDISTGRSGPVWTGRGMRLEMRSNPTRSTIQKQPNPLLAGIRLLQQLPSERLVLILELRQHRSIVKHQREKANKLCHPVWELSQEEFIMSWRCGFRSPLSSSTHALVSLFTH